MLFEKFMASTLSGESKQQSCYFVTTAVHTQNPSIRDFDHRDDKIKNEADLRLFGAYM